MFKLIILIIFVNNLNHVISGKSPAPDCGTPQCGKNEEYSDCPNKVCRAKKCSDLGFPLPCYEDKNKSTDCGKPSCICKQGFVKNKDGKCIDAKECPSCGGDPNAWTGCGSFCTRCDNYKDKNRVCSMSCQLNGCECRPNYVYYPQIKKCVLPKDCPQCGKNEEYSDCPNKVCRPKKCDDLGFPLPCYKDKNKSIKCDKPCCICKAGFVRNKDGKCIDSKDCPSCGGDPNAWPGCGSFCTRCDNYKDKNRVCPASCQLNGCECRPNKVYDSKNKKCVLPKNCPIC